MPYFSIAMRSMPMPQAKPWYTSGSMPQLRSTLGCTMPQPRISSQSFALAETDLALVAAALHVDFQRRLGEREERRPEPHLDVVDLEERLAEFLQHPFEVAEMRALVDHQAFDLVEHRRVGLVGVAAIGAARADHADRRLLRQHGAHLHRRGVGAQQQPRAVGLRVEEERVVHFPRRMACGKFSLVKL